jgi:hypothetical protein
MFSFVLKFTFSTWPEQPAGIKGFKATQFDLAICPRCCKHKTRALHIM